MYFGRILINDIKAFQVSGHIYYLSSSDLFVVVAFQNYVTISLGLVYVCLEWIFIFFSLHNRRWWNVLLYPIFWIPQPNQDDPDTIQLSMLIKTNLQQIVSLNLWMIQRAIFHIFVWRFVLTGKNGLRPPTVTMTITGRHREGIKSFWPLASAVEHYDELIEKTVNPSNFGWVFCERKFDEKHDLQQGIRDLFTEADYMAGCSQRSKFTSGQEKGNWDYYQKSKRLMKEWTSKQKK